MKYISTRGDAPVLAFDDVLLSGLASDGGRAFMLLDAAVGDLG